MSTNRRASRRGFAARCLGTFRLASLLVLLLALAPFGGRVAAQVPADLALTLFNSNEFVYVY